MEQDFAHITPNEYLMAVAPLQTAHYRLEALAAPQKIADMLAIDVKSPCLVLKRSTRSQNQVATYATLWHPGGRYQFTGKVS